MKILAKVVKKIKKDLKRQMDTDEHGFNFDFIRVRLWLFYLYLNLSLYSERNKTL